jgi:serine/threonine-protein kinase
VLLDLRDQQNDAWVWALESRTLTRVSFDRRAGGPVVWTADGARAFFAPTRNGQLNIFWAPVSGGAEERLLTSANVQYANAATPDGRYLLFEEVDPQTKFDLRLLALEGTRESKPLVQTPFNDQNAALSADGAWLAYQSDESGRAEIYVRPFPDVNAGRWLVSTAGATRPLWSRDGRELFFLDLDRRLTVVSIDTTPIFRAGPARTLFDTKPFGLEGINRNFDISPDGSRFLFVRNRPVPPDAKRLIVVQHWFEELERLLPR